jgi:hypothetical protein
MRKLLPLVAALACAILGARYFDSQDAGNPRFSREADLGRSNSGASESAIERAYRERRSNLQLRGDGTATRVLADDNDGDRHQRIILELASGNTVLIAHNIDLAPRIPGIRDGDQVAFYGEYEWNEQGGVVHWTHTDPANRHIAGWLEHEGKRYQ